MSERHLVPEREKARALLDQALAEARSHGAGRIAALHFVVYGSFHETEARLRSLLQELSANTPAEGAQVIIRAGPKRFICWNCCGLRFDSDEEEAVCPNCGHTATPIPTDITFALDHVEMTGSASDKNRRMNWSPVWSLWMILLTAQVILSLFLYNPAGSKTLQIAGWGIGAFTGILGVWPIIALRRRGAVPPGKSYTHTTVLVDSGIYAIVRHPQYLSFMLFSLFLMLVIQHWFVAAISVAAIALAYVGIVPQADRENLEKFGAAYAQYMQEVPRLNLLAGIVRRLRRK